jgi:tRNA/tmRNA/rRNA uracil-C5-methylase (TrmA/RlmC/RlmD family)
MSAAGAGSLVGRRLTLTVGNLAHGGHCVSRHEGRVVFVRHALPGERVVAEVTEGEERSRYLRADAVQVLEAGADRVRPRCPVARPGGCGGCDFQHVSLPAQRRLLAGVVGEQLSRLAGLDVPVVVEPVPGDEDGLGWRTRVRFTTDDDGRLGLRKHRSHEVVPLQQCPIGHPGLPDVTGHLWPGAASVEAVVSGAGERAVVVEPRGRAPVKTPDLDTEGLLTTTGRRLRGRTYVTEPAAGRRWRVSAAGFWQVHPGAAEALVGAALQMLGPQPGETALDLYSGAGLFAGTLAQRVGGAGSVLAVEGDARAARDARRNLHDLPQVRLLQARVQQALRDLPVDAVDVVLLDPPRVGARRRVVEDVVALRPRAVCYVACDPAALARDVAIFGENGYELTRLRAFDIFPMTHHVECVALLTPRNAAPG